MGWVCARLIPASRGIRVEPRWKSRPAARVVGRKLRGPAARAAAAEARPQHSTVLLLAACWADGPRSDSFQCPAAAAADRGPHLRFALTLATRPWSAVHADACARARRATLTRGIGRRTECGPSDYESDHGVRPANRRKKLLPPSAVADREEGRTAGRARSPTQPNAAMSWAASSRAEFWQCLKNGRFAVRCGLPQLDLQQELFGQSVESGPKE